MIRNTSEIKTPTWIEKTLSQLPLVSHYAGLRGTAYVISWLHRITGLLIVGFIGFHILKLQALKDPQAYNTIMAAYSSSLFVFLEWALAIPVILHALNGGRLILFESFGFREDYLLLNWVLGTGLVYCLILGAVMLSGGLTLPDVLYWGPAMAMALALSYRGGRKIWQTAHSALWKMQRTSGLFLLIMAPAHLLFMHMNTLVSKDAGTILTRLQNPFIKIVDITLAIAVLYHGTYGLISIINDYVANPLIRRMATNAAMAISFIFFILAARLLFL